MKIKDTLGVSNTKSFILKYDTPILTIKGSKVEDSGSKLMAGTVIEGFVKTRIISNDKDKKTPYKFIQIFDGKKGINQFISPKTVNLYINDFSDAENTVIKTKKTAWGENKSNANGNVKKKNNIFVKYGLPLIGTYIGYRIAKHKGVSGGKMALFIIGFGLLGALPSFINKK